jgi:hypothetical protein
VLFAEALATCEQLGLPRALRRGRELEALLPRVA